MSSSFSPASANTSSTRARVPFPTSAFVPKYLATVRKSLKLILPSPVTSPSARVAFFMPQFPDTSRKSPKSVLPSPFASPGCAAKSHDAVSGLPSQSSPSGGASSGAGSDVRSQDAVSGLPSQSSPSGGASSGAGSESGRKML